MKALIIQPRELLREELLKTLSSFGFGTIIAVATISEGVENILRRGLLLDLVVTHWGQAEEGREVVFALSGLPKKIPLIVVSGGIGEPKPGEADVFLRMPHQFGRGKIREALEKLFP